MPQVDLTSLGTARPAECDTQPAPTVTAPSAASSPGVAPSVGARPEESPAEIVTSYGCQHLDTYVGLWADGANIVVLLTGDFPAHQAALDALAGVGRVRVALGTVLMTTRAKIANELGAYATSHPNTLQGFGSNLETVDVQLGADQLVLAEQFAHRYGQAITVQVGNFFWSLNGPVAAPGAGTCPSTADFPDSSSDLDMTLQLPRTVRAGAGFTGTLVVTNRGNAALNATTGSSSVAILREIGTDKVVGTFTGVINTSALLVTLASGASQSFPVVGGTATCVAPTAASTGASQPAGVTAYATAPGHYEVVASFTTVATPGTQITYLSKPVPIDVTR
jgi:hypothetical protein